MKRILLILLIAAASCTGNNTCSIPEFPGSHGLHYSFEELPLGAIRPEGWLRETLIRQRDGISANLDETYPQVLGADNGWLGGTGDFWERGPYWIDGLLPLAYILDDDALKAKVRPWVESMLASAKPNGYFGPDKGYPARPGIQCDKPFDWWPKMVALKVLRQHYNATQDSRVLDLMCGYFRYQLDSLPSQPLDKWSFWSRYRAGDEMDVLLWYYAKTGDKNAPKLAALLHEQGFDFTGEFLKGELLAREGLIHGVNLAQGLKEPVIWWQLHPEQKYLDAVHKGMADIRLHHGYANGMFGADEALHGNSPTQGSELCSAVELMYSYEQMLKVTGEPLYADELERVAFNALPAQVSEDFKYHQYFQQANQVSASLGNHNFDCANSGTSLVFGFLAGYPCCLTNLHQGWPKFTQNLWLRSADGGLAALVYSPCRVETDVAGVNVSIKEDTAYPFEESVRFILGTDKAVSFPISLRIPSWCEGASVNINGKEHQADAKGNVVIQKTWSDGDEILLHLPMQTSISRWQENAVSIERGPLVYALGIKEKWQNTTLDGNLRKYHGDSCLEVLPDSPWNYGLTAEQLKAPENLKVEVDSSKMAIPWPWGLDSAPIRIIVSASRIPEWQLYCGDAGPLSWSPLPEGDVNHRSPYKVQQCESITLVPYGCTRLRISEFPVLTR